MSEPVSDAPAAAIGLRDVSKVYRLYRRPAYRVLDVIGLCPANAEYYTEHAALEGVSLSVGRGEKVAVIGRNGAGKSTLLKVITGVIKPTGGDVKVQGEISNLLQIGSGFHPDFTGRQNVFANLAHRGIVGREASALFDEILQFAEIEEYIDHPMKTYSTGMCSRLMFSAAIMQHPDILVVDEILGVGDAYFSHKSFQRMRDLCSGEGTTLLLVTHDIYSALDLCDRFIWIDRGRVCFDGDGKSAIALYESSVKAQEEQTLRRHNVATIAAADEAKASETKANETKLVQLMIRSRTGFALRRPLALDLIEVRCDDGSHTTLPVAHGAVGWDLLPESSLGPPETVSGRSCRVLRATGSIYHKAEWTVRVPAGAVVDGVQVRWRYDGDEPADLRVFDADRRILVAGELGGATEWNDETFFRSGQAPQELEAQKQVDYGTGKARIVNVRFLDADGRETVRVPHGQPLSVRIALSVGPELEGQVVTFAMSFARAGSGYLGIVYEPRLRLPAQPECEIDVQLESVRLGSGQWYLNVGVGEEGIYNRQVVGYFATDPAWHHALVSRIELYVDSVSGLDASGCFVVHPATVTCAPIQDHQTL